MAFRRKGGRLSQRRSSPMSRRQRDPKRAGVRLLEGMIMLLVGLNLYLFYSVLQPASSEPLRFETRSSEQATPAEPVQVEVLNGSGKDRLSQQARSYLRRQGFDVVYIGNAENFDFPKTVVLDRLGKDTISDAARAVAYALGTTHVILQRNDERMVDVTAIIGHDHDMLKINED